MNIEMDDPSPPRSVILIVDDIEENLVALEALLRRDDAQVLMARGGTEALELVLLHEFSLAFIDVQMPDMDGFELAELMRGAERSRYIPIIFVTAGTGDAHRVFRGYESGAVDFLLKPIDPYMLRQKADTFIRLDQQRKLLARQYARIQENEALLRAVMDATSALIYVKDVQGRYVSTNRRFAELPGIGSRTIIGATDHELFPLQAADAFRRNDELAVAQGCAIQVEEKLTRGDNSRTYLSSKVPLRDAQDRIWGICGVSTDISELKRLERELEQAVQARDDVLAVVSHDMRNFLQAIRSGVEMLGKRGHTLSEEVKNTIHSRIRITVDLMTRMITDLMDMANIRTGRIAVTMRAEIIDNLLHDALSVHEPLAVAKGITLTSHVECRNSIVVCDRERILQVLANLLGNAIKFCRDGCTIEVTAHGAGTELLIAVSDTGPGIAATDLPHVFDAYWSGSENRATGTGLGLYITRRIVEAHGARIWIESEVGRGTCVHFSLPLQAAATRPA